MTIALEGSIQKEIRRWSKEVLEIPSPHFNGVPPCPYAQKAWAEDKVAILFKHEENYQSLYSCISQFDDKFELAILVDLSNNKTSEAFHEYLDDLNDFIATGAFIDKDIWLMGFHPDDEPNEFVEKASIEAETDEPYAMIFIQRLSKVQDSADKLNKTGYYSIYETEYNASELFEKRKKIYRRLKNGNETS